MARSGLALWQDDPHPPATARPSLAGDLTVDVAIVGGGFTGLWTAWYLRRLDPTLRVVVLEAETVGFGGSGRNGGWCSALLPMGLATMSESHGRDSATRMQRAMFATVDEIGRTSHTLGIDCHFAKGGTLTLARHEAHAARIRADIEEHRAYGFDESDFRWLSAAEASAMVHSNPLVGAAYTPHCAAIHPARLVSGLADAVESAGVPIHERTRVGSIEAGQVRTEHGDVRAEVVVRATEAWTARLRGMQRAIVPIYSLMIATEPLPDDVLAEIGLAERATFTDARRLVIYGQRTADGRIAFGGRGAPYHFRSAIDPAFDHHPRVHAALADTLREAFPVLARAAITHEWGGPVGAPRDWHCSVGLDRAKGLAWAGGYVGDGVSTSNLAGRTLADLITGTASDLTSLPWVGHRSPAWEPEPLRWLGINTLVRLPASIDRAETRGRSPRWRSKLLDRLTGH